MARTTISILVGCMVLLLPAICAGGWLLHACDCGPAGECEHEIGCSSDPCEVGVAKTAASESIEFKPVECLTPTFVTGPQATTSSWIQLDAEFRHVLSDPVSNGLPRPQSDSPLLI